MHAKRMVSVAAIVGLTIMGTACGAAKDEDPTPVTHFKITPASGAKTPPASATAAAQATPAATAQATANGAATAAIKTSNSSLKFDQEKLTATAGALTIAFDNQDSGIPHNVSVHEGNDATGKTLGKTDIEAGPVKQELKLDLAPGLYYFQCDAHPTTMKGTLTVR